MARSIRQPAEGKEELGADVEYFDTGGRADLKVSRHFFKALVQAVFLFGEDMWVLSPRIEQALSSFQHRVARRLTRRNLCRRAEGSW